MILFVKFFLRFYYNEFIYVYDFDNIFDVFQRVFIIKKVQKEVVFMMLYLFKFLVIVYDIGVLEIIIFIIVIIIIIRNFNVLVFIVNRY